METFICTTCGTQYAKSIEPPQHCPICEDERQFVNWNGQEWTTLAQLLTGDIIQVVQDRRFVSFMRSFPNYIPLSASAVQRVVNSVEPFPFKRIYGAWRDAIVSEGGHSAVKRSAARYLQALGRPD